MRCHPIPFTRYWDAICGQQRWTVSDNRKPKCQVSWFPRDLCVVHCNKALLRARGQGMCDGAGILPRSQEKHDESTLAWRLFRCLAGTGHLTSPPCYGIRFLCFDHWTGTFFSVSRGLFSRGWHTPTQWTFSGVLMVFESLYANRLSGAEKREINQICVQILAAPFVRCVI